MKYLERNIVKINLQKIVFKNEFWLREIKLSGRSEHGFADVGNVNILQSPAITQN